ncbi:MAG TPA: hypothetical protein VGR08_09490 [Thermomicrobiales bacterium]|nr:hypothetical protein [Thermomicrobiales bacterium]
MATEDRRQAETTPSRPGHSEPVLDQAVQQPLPRRAGVWGKNASFAHPAEREVARILDFFGIRWSYEPTAFLLRSHPDGRPAEMMTPDFFLPDLDLYLEVTTMRQSLVSRKNRKARLLRERYPGVRLKLLYRADYQRLVGLYRGVLNQEPHELTLNVFLSRDSISSAVSDITTRILARCERALTSTDRLPVLVVSNRGALPLLHDCLHQLRACGMSLRSCELSFTVSGSRSRVTPVRSRTMPAPGEQVILLETLVSTGMHLAHVQRWLAQRGVVTLDTIALCARRGSSLMGSRADYVAFEAPNHVLAGYGLQLQSELAKRPDMVTVAAPAFDPVISFLTGS